MMARGRGSSRSVVPRKAQRNRTGFALAAALLAVVLIGALIAGVLFATTEETRARAVRVEREVALNACESAIATTITDPGLRLPDSIGVGGTISGHVGGPGPEIIVYITRLDSTLYSIVAESVAEPANASGPHRVGVVVRSSIAVDRSIAIDPISERPWFELF
jgi:type II secretory pathway pseudopilin PulG